MCSHILSDIEVLCDRVAILRGGRLAQIGYLEDLRQKVAGRNQVEVVLSGIDETTLKPHLPGGHDFLLRSTPAGLRIEIKDERDVDSVITALRKAGGKLVSVQPLKQSLEELFLESGGTETSD